MFALCGKKKKDKKIGFLGGKVNKFAHNGKLIAIVTVKQRTKIKTLSLIFIFKTEINYPF